MTRRLANRNGIPLENMRLRLVHECIHAQGCAECEVEDGQIERITRRIRLTGPLDGQQRWRLIEIADRCPVHRILEAGPVITTQEER